MFYNYILHNTLNNTTYNGYTNDIDKRLRQHNGELAGGARSTRKHQGHWKYLAIVSSEQFDKSTAMSFEWWVRYPTGKKPRPKEYTGPKGRLEGLRKVLDMPKWQDFTFEIKISE